MFNWAEENKVPLLDCIPLLKNSGIDWGELFKVEIDDHPTAVAHRVMGEALAEFLRPLLATK